MTEYDHDAHLQPADPKYLGDEVIEITFDPVEFIAGALEEMTGREAFELNATVTMYSDGSHEVFRGPEQRAKAITGIAMTVLKLRVYRALEAKDWSDEIEAAIKSQVGDGRE